MEKFIKGTIEGKPFSAFITSNKPPCPKGGEHEWDGEELMTFHNDDRFLKFSEFKLLSKEEQEMLNQESGQSSCSKCGIGSMQYDNPHYL